MDLTHRNNFHRFMLIIEINIKNILLKLAINSDST